MHMKVFAAAWEPATSGEGVAASIASVLDLLPGLVSLHLVGVADDCRNPQIGHGLLPVRAVACRFPAVPLDRQEMSVFVLEGVVQSFGGAQESSA
jgi:hypothetical protein